MGLQVSWHGTAKVVGRIELPEGNVNSKVYQKMLEKKLLPTPQQKHDRAR